MRLFSSGVFLSFALLVLFALPSCSSSPSGPEAAVPAIDIDGNEYRTVRIGDQIWMAENLRVGHYRNGDPIEEVTGLDEWVALESGARCMYDNDPAKGEEFGYLYNWYAVEDPRGLAPEGWRIPTEEDWRALETYLGMNPDAAADVEFRGGEQLVGDKLKAGGSNETGFSALHGGYRDNDGPFCFFGKYGAFWTATPNDEANRVWFRGMTTNEPGVYRFSFNRKCGFSVRCVRDAE